MNDEIEGINARLTAIEHLTHLIGLWAQALSALPGDHADALAASIGRSAEKWALSERSGPQDVAVIQRHHAAARAYLGVLVERMRALEQLLRPHPPKHSPF